MSGIKAGGAWYGFWGEGDFRLTGLGEIDIAKAETGYGALPNAPTGSSEPYLAIRFLSRMEHLNNSTSS
ncbi:MAG: hypothetical protein AAFO68_08870, partial [Pseudomonadota bacterium]